MRVEENLGRLGLAVPNLAELWRANASGAHYISHLPGFTLAGYARLRQRHAEHPLQRVLMEGLRRAGVPEGPAQA